MIQRYFKKCITKFIYKKIIYKYISKILILNIVVCGRCIYSYKRICKFIDKGIINNDELISESDKFI